MDGHATTEKTPSGVVSGGATRSAVVVEAPLHVAPLIALVAAPVVAALAAVALAVALAAAQVAVPARPN